MATDYKVGDKIVLFKKHQEAIIRYIGKAHFAPDKVSYGLELLDEGIGDNNGSVDDKKYFDCPENKGLFVWETDIKFKIQKRKKSMKSNKSKVHRKESSNIYDAVFPEPTKTPTLTDKNSSSIFSKRTKARKLGPRDVGRNDTYYGMDDELGLNNNNTSNSPKKKKKKTKKKKKDDEQPVSLKKLGPRDVGRNDDYDGIEFELDKDGNKIIAGSIQRKKSMKKEKVMLSRKKKKKKTKKKKGKKKKKTKQKSMGKGDGDNLAQNEQNNGDDSDSYKSGYSGASGHSGFSGDSVGSPRAIADPTNDNKGYEGTGSEDSGDTESEEDDSGEIVDVQDYENEEEEEDQDQEQEQEQEPEMDLTQKVMLMMKQKQEEKEKEDVMKKEEEERLAAERAAEEDKMGMVALTHKQMEENNEYMSLSADEAEDNEDQEEHPPKDVDQDVNTENVAKDEDVTEKVPTNEGNEEEEIDDDLPAPNNDKELLSLDEQASTKKMLTYAKRKNSEYDTANEEPEEPQQQEKDKDEEQEQEQEQEQNEEELPLKKKPEKQRSPSEEELDAMRMSSIYKRISQKSLDIDKAGKDNKYDALSTSDNEDIDKFKDEIKKADDAQRTSTIENESNSLKPKQSNQGQTNNIDDVPPNVKEAQKGGCCVIL